MAVSSDGGPDFLARYPHHGAISISQQVPGRTVRPELFGVITRDRVHRDSATISGRERASPDRGTMIHDHGQ